MSNTPPDPPIDVRLRRLMIKATAKMDSRISYNSPMDQFHWQAYLMLTEWTEGRLKEYNHIQVRDLELVTRKARSVSKMRERGRYIIEKYKDRRSS